MSMRVACVQARDIEDRDRKTAQVCFVRGGDQPSSFSHLSSSYYYVLVYVLRATKLFPLLRSPYTLFMPFLYTYSAVRFSLYVRDLWSISAALKLLIFRKVHFKTKQIGPFFGLNQGSFWQGLRKCMVREDPCPRTRVFRPQSSLLTGQKIRLFGSE